MVALIMAYAAKPTAIMEYQESRKTHCRLLGRPLSYAGLPLSLAPSPISREIIAPTATSKIDEGKEKYMTEALVHKAKKLGQL